MAAVMAVERKVGYSQRDVKGRIRGAKTVTITKNEILTALIRPDEYDLDNPLAQAEEPE